MRKNNIYYILFSVFVSVFLSIIVATYTGCGGDNTTTVITNCSGDPDSIPDSTKGTAWTIMVYADGDNNLENYLLQDIMEMKAGFVNNQGINLIVLVDRKDGVFCDGFNEKFTDTRLYQISHNKAKRISGSAQFPEITATSNYEANMGDATTLKKFIQFCKINYPATNDALILWNHGGGPKGVDSITQEEIKSDKLPFKSVCADDTDDDILYTAEITDAWTSTEKVDLLGFDACIMGSVEIAYQFRPGNGSLEADVMVASPANEWGYGWKYDEIFKRLRHDIIGDSGGINNVAGTGNEQYIDPQSMAPLDLGGLIVEEQYDSTTSRTDQTLSCYDLTKVGAVKTAIDTLAVSLTNEQSNFDTYIRGPVSSPITMHYFNAANGSEWLDWPFFDLYDLSERTNAATTHFNAPIPANALAVMNALYNSSPNGLVVYSFAGSYYTGFQNGKNGIYIFFPDGDAIHYGGEIDWTWQWWYNAKDVSSHEGDGYYGNLTWCINDKNGNPTSVISTVENWFEMLDSWFDPTNSGTGGLNGYQW